MRSSRRWRLALSSTRSRVLTAALALLALTIAVSIVVDRAVLLTRLDERIDRELAQEVDEFRRLAGGIDPDTGQPFGEDLNRIFDTFFDRNVPGKDEVILSLVDGRPYARSAAPAYPIEELGALVESWASAGEPGYRTDDTPVGRLRSLVVPVAASDGEVLGTFIVGRFPAGERAEVDEAVRVAASVGAAAFLVAALLAWVIAGRVLAPLHRLGVAAASVREEDLTHRIPVRGRGELAELTATFNAMLERVDHAVATQRAFLDDAGHELRTPLTIARGHLELVAPDDPLPASTRNLVLDELDRMSRIVDDLLTMAKAERPDFVVPSPVDVDDLTTEIVDKARPLADRDWQVRSEAVVVALLDRQRVVQAWMNLVRNAVQHTVDGDRIEVFARAVPGWVELGVADSGEGVSPQDRDRIFERFGRGDSGRRSHTDGAGLGLAIASAIVRAHGGTVELRDTPGGGATFALRLPRVDPVAEDDERPTEEQPWPAS